MSETRLPVTLLTGFLGAGKSTLLNKVLADGRSGRVAVIVNEFGEVGIDHDLIESTSEEVVLLSSGCICCSIRGDLAETIATLIEKRDAGRLMFDRVVIETTGLADPAPIQQTLLVDYTLSQLVFLDGVVTLVDAANGQKTLDAQFEAVSQAATADLVLLTKTDLVTTDDVAALRSRLEGLNPTARMVEVGEAVRDPATLWGVSGMRRAATVEDVLPWMSREAAPNAPFAASSPTAPTKAPKAGADLFANLSGLAKSRAPQPSISAHDARIASASITLDAPLEDEVFDRWLDTLVALKGRDLLRVKGIVFLKGIEAPFVFHGVQHIFDPPQRLQNWPKGDTTSRVVVIARDMTTAQLERSLDMLRATKIAKKQPAVFPGWKDVEAENWP